MIWIQQSIYPSQILLCHKNKRSLSSDFVTIFYNDWTNLSQKASEGMYKVDNLTTYLQNTRFILILLSLISKRDDFNTSQNFMFCSRPTWWTLCSSKTTFCSMSQIFTVLSSELLAQMFSWASCLQNEKPETLSVWPLSSPVGEEMRSVMTITLQACNQAWTWASEASYLGLLLRMRSLSAGKLCF